MSLTSNIEDLNVRNILKSELPQQLSNAEEAFLRRKLKELVSNQKKTSDNSDLLRVVELLDQLQQNEDYSGFHKWFVPGSPYGIDKLPKHKILFAATRDYRETLMLGGNRCLAEGTLVATPKGPVAIQDLSVGDFVYDCYGNPTKVLNKIYNGQREVVKLTNRGKEWLWCTSDHELDCIESRRNRRRLKLRADGQIQETQVRRVYTKAPLGYWNEPHAYVIGAMLGDGCGTCGSSNRFVISSKDEAVPQRIASILNCEYAKNKGNHSWTVYGTFNLYEECINNKLCHEKSVPSDIKFWNRASILNFVAGLIDTDGSLSVSKDGACLSLTAQNTSIIEAFKYCVLALWNEPVSVSTDSRSKYKNGNVFVAYIRNPHALARICEELKPFLTRKNKAQLPKTGHGHRSYPDRIALKVSDKKLAHVWDITVEHEEHLFLLANGLSVSNCGKTTAGATVAAILATGQYPEWWEGVRYKNPTSIWAIGKTGQTTRDTVQEALMGPVGNWGTGAIPYDCIGRTTARQGIPNALDTVEIIHVSGGTSTIGFKSYDQKPSAFYGTAKHLVWLDEPCPDLVYHECLVRTMKLKEDPQDGPKGGRLLHTITPKEGLTRLLAEFLSTCDLLGDAERIKGLEAMMRLAELEDKKEDPFGYD